ncbi:hypothetical protein Hanom_Chr10g00910541 [Helianthus anomalus]
MMNFFFKYLIYLLYVVLQASNVIFDPLHNSCDFDEEKNTKLSEFRSILELMRRVPIQKALTDQHLVKVINSVVKQNDEKKSIIVSEAVVRQVLDFPDDVNSPTKFPERMVKGGMLRMGYYGALNNANYLKSSLESHTSFLFTLYCRL